MDTMRPDHLSGHGYELKTSPNIDAFARENTSLVPFYTVAPWTSPAVASLFTGLYPTSHGVLSHASLQEEKPELYSLPDSAATLAERFKRAGYRTGAVSSNPWVLPGFGFDQGFDDFIILKNKDSAEKITDEAIGWIDELGAKRPFFLYLHYMDCHGPYIPPEPYSRMFLPQKPVEKQRVVPKDVIPLYLDLIPDGTTTLEILVSQYDGAIRYFDDQFARMISSLKEKNLYDDMVIVFTGDHGEELMEHGRVDHGWTLYQEQLLVPFILKFPSGKEATVDLKGRVPEIIDIYPTVLSLAGLGVPRDIAGDDLLQPGTAEPAFAEADKEFKYAALIGEKYKYIRHLKKKKASLYNTLEDPCERNDLLEAREASLDVKWDKSLISRMNSLKENALKPELADVQDELLERLRSIDYLKR